MKQCNPDIGLWMQGPSGAVTNSQLSLSARFCNCISELYAKHDIRIRFGTWQKQRYLVYDLCQYDRIYLESDKGIKRR